MLSTWLRGYRSYVRLTYWVRFWKVPGLVTERSQDSGHSVLYPKRPGGRKHSQCG